MKQPHRLAPFGLDIRHRLQLIELIVMLHSSYFRDFRKG